MATPFDEMLQFLDPGTRPDLKLIGTNHLMGMTNSDDGLTLFSENWKFIKAFISLLEDNIEDIRKNAYTALINLSANEKIAVQIVERACQELVMNLLNYILDRDYDHADGACMLLANLSRPQVCAELIANSIANDKNKHDIIDDFVTILCTSNMSGTKAKYHHLSYVLCNLSQVQRISDKFVKDGLLKKLLPFMDYKDSIVRRRGAVATVRNCCLNTAYHETLLGCDIDLLPRLLLPLAGPEEFDDEDNETLPVELQYLEPSKEREPDAKIRRLLVESINQLCATKAGRIFLKDKNAYIILREFHKWERDDVCYLAIMNVIDILIGDEPPEKYENLKAVDVPEELMEKFDKEDQEFLKG